MRQIPGPDRPCPDCGAMVSGGLLHDCAEYAKRLEDDVNRLVKLFNADNAPTEG